MCVSVFAHCYVSEKSMIVNEIALRYGLNYVSPKFVC